MASILRLVSLICLLSGINTTLTGRHRRPHNFGDGAEEQLPPFHPPPQPQPQPRCELGHISTDNVVPRGGFRVDHMQLLGRADSSASLSNFILECCQLGPAQCQYMWIVDNICYAISCREDSDDCMPLTITSPDDFTSIYFKMTVSDQIPDLLGDGKEGEIEPERPSTGSPENLGGGADREGGPADDREGGEGEKTVMVDAYPVANAGPDVTIMYPSHTTVFLNGSNSTDDNGIKYYLWQLTAQDHLDQATLIDPTLPYLQVLNLTPGTYTFTLTVADSSLQISTDQVTVRVVQEEIQESTTLPSTTLATTSPPTTTTISLASKIKELAPPTTSSDAAAVISGNEVSTDGSYSKKSNLIKVAVPVLVVLAVILMISACIVTASFFMCDRNKRHMKHLYRYKRLPETIQKT